MLMERFIITEEEIAENDLKDVIPVVLIQQNVYILSYICSQNTTNHMSDSITVYYTTTCNTQLHVLAL
jgi:hypothetical protein